MRNWFNELVKMLDDKAREMFGKIAGAWAERVPEIAGEMSSPRWGFSAENPASPAELAEVISFMEERELLTDEKPDETFTQNIIERAAREVKLDCVVYGDVSKVVCQCPGHRGNAPFHVPTQKYIVIVGGDGKLIRMCHRDTDIEILSGGFVVDLTTGEKVWYFCPVCGHFAKKSAKAEGGRLTLYRLGEALEVAAKVRDQVERGKMIAAQAARSAEQSRAIIHAASCGFKGKSLTSPRARSNNRHARELSGARESDFGDRFDPINRPGSERHRRHLRQ